MEVQDRQEVKEVRLEGNPRGSFRMDFQEQKVAEARVISGDYRLSRADFEKLVYGFGEFGADYFALEYFYRMRPSSLAASRR